MWVKNPTLAQLSTYAAFKSKSARMLPKHMKPADLESVSKCWEKDATLVAFFEIFTTAAKLATYKNDHYSWHELRGQFLSLHKLYFSLVVQEQIDAAESNPHHKTYLEKQFKKQAVILYENGNNILSTLRRFAVFMRTITTEEEALVWLADISRITPQQLKSYAHSSPLARVDYEGFIYPLFHRLLHAKRITKEGYDQMKMVEADRLKELASYKNLQTTMFMIPYSSANNSNSSSSSSSNAASPGSAFPATDLNVEPCPFCRCKQTRANGSSAGKSELKRGRCLSCKRTFNLTGKVRSLSWSKDKDVDTFFRTTVGKTYDAYKSATHLLTCLRNLAKFLQTKLKTDPTIVLCFHDIAALTPELLTAYAMHKYPKSSAMCNGTILPLWLHMCNSGRISKTKYQLTVAKVNAVVQAKGMEIAKIEEEKRVAARKILVDQFLPSIVAHGFGIGEHVRVVLDGNCFDTTVTHHNFYTDYATVRFAGTDKVCLSVEAAIVAKNNAAELDAVSLNGKTREEREHYVAQATEAGFGIDQEIEIVDTSCWNSYAVVKIVAYHHLPTVSRIRYTLNKNKGSCTIQELQQKQRDLVARKQYVAAFVAEATVAGFAVGQKIEIRAFGDARSVNIVSYVHSPLYLPTSSLVCYKVRGVGGTTTISIQELQQKQNQRRNEVVAAAAAAVVVAAAAAAAAATKAAEAAAAAQAIEAAKAKFIEDVNAAGFGVGNEVRIQEIPGQSSIFVNVISVKNYVYANYITYQKPDFTINVCSIVQLKERQQAAVVADADRVKRYNEKVARDQKENQLKLKRQRDLDAAAVAVGSSSMKKQKYNYVDGIKVEPCET